MESDMWLILAIFCFVIEAVLGGVRWSGRAESWGYGGSLFIALGLAFFAISFLSMVTRSV